MPAPTNIKRSIPSIRAVHSKTFLTYSMLQDVKNLEDIGPIVKLSDHEVYLTNEDGCLQKLHCNGSHLMNCNFDEPDEPGDCHVPSADPSLASMVKPA